MLCFSVNRSPNEFSHLLENGNYTFFYILKTINFIFIVCLKFVDNVGSSLEGKQIKYRYNTKCIWNIFVLTINIIFLANTNHLTKYANENSTKVEEKKSSFGKLLKEFILVWILYSKLIFNIILQDIPQGALAHSSYSECETSSVESQSDTTGNSEYYTLIKHCDFKIPDTIESSVKKQNSYLPSSFSMQSVPSNKVNENVFKRPTSLPVFKQNGV